MGTFKTAKLTASLLARKGGASPAKIPHTPLPGMVPALPGPTAVTEETRSARQHHDIKMSVRLPRPLHQKLKLVAAVRRHSLQQVVESAMAEFLEQQELPIDDQCDCMRRLTPEP